MTSNKFPGLVVLLGSGETLPSSGKTHEYLAKNLPAKPKIAILETPAGFELNSEGVAGKIKEFLDIRLQNYTPEIFLVPARKRGTAFSPDDAGIVAPLLRADEILLGPGSPTYAVRQLKDSLAFEMIQARHRLGAAVFLSSAATLAFGSHTIPVYEIFKVGEEPHWKEGLDFFGHYGLDLTIVPHWNNTDGGSEVDTSRCYIGRLRFEQLYGLLPKDGAVIGIDEHTALLFDFKAGCCRVMGNGSVHILLDGQEKQFETGTSFPLDQLGDWHVPDNGEGIDVEVWAQAVAVQEAMAADKHILAEPTSQVLSLLEERDQARQARDWAKADQLRSTIESLGWQVVDTPDASRVIPMES